MNEWKKWKIETIDKNSDDFPDKLKQLKDCPEKLYFRGKWDKKLFEKNLSIVGSRRMTRYGKEVVDKVVPELVANRVTIISGFMYGVDCEAHQKCVEMGGKTIAVLGGGIDFLSPIENDKLYSQIVENEGLVISEYEPNFKPTLWSFPQRNRIVAALSTLGILVVEAGVKSGSLITAKLGQRLQKNIWAVPGPITSSTSEGTNFLIKNNLAKMLTSTEDILEKKPEVAQDSLFDQPDLSMIEKKIVEALSREEMTVDEIARATGENVGVISANLSLLGIKNLVEDEAGKYYGKRR